MDVTLRVTQPAIWRVIWLEFLSAIEFGIRSRIINITGNKDKLQYQWAGKFA